MKKKQKKKREFEQIKISNYDFDHDYFNFDLNDIELSKIEKAFHPKVQNELLENLQNQFTNCITFLKKDIAQLSYPYLQNAYELFFEKINDDFHKKYLILLTIGHQKEIIQIIQQFYHNLINSKYFDISPEIKKRTKSEVFGSDDYKSFTLYLSYWHAHSEIVILYLSLMNTSFDTQFEFDKDKFSYQAHYKPSFLIFAKRNLFKLTSCLIGQFTLNKNIDIVKLECLLLCILTTGFNLSTLLSYFPVTTIMTTIGIIGFNTIVGKFAAKINQKSNFLEIQMLQDVIQKLNEKLKKLINYEKTLMKLQLKKEMLNDEGQGLVMSIDEALKLLKYKIEKYLKDVNINENKEKITGEKMNELVQLYESNQFEEEWTMIYVLYLKKV